MIIRVVWMCFLLVLISGCDIETDKDFGLYIVEQPTIENYAQARRIFWESVYPGDSLTLYCAKSFHAKHRSGINVEHVFPMSWATNGLNCGTRKQCRQKSADFNQIEADMHNLFPARSDVNQVRSSYRFGLVSGEARRFGKQCDFEVNTKSRVAEPMPTVRGDVARAMFYMADHYKKDGLVLFEKQAKLLYKWHKADPPSEHEHYRNDVIESLQGNRNPYIDKPERLDSLMLNGYFF